MRYSLILLLPAVAYAMGTQMAAHGDTAHGDKATKGQTSAKPSHHRVARNKHTAGHSLHASHAIHGQHSTGGGAHVQHMSAHHHSLPRGRSSTGASPTPTPTPATEAETPAPDLTATPTPAE
jgi:hypothetical protein